MLNATIANVAEGALVRMKVLRSGNVEVAANVSYEGVDVTAGAADYSGGSGLLRFAPNQTRGVVGDV